MKKGHWGKWFSTVIGTPVGITVGAIVGTVAVALTGGGILILAGVTAATATAGGITGGFIGYKTGSDTAADWDATILLVPNTANILKDLKCDALPARGEQE